MKVFDLLVVQRFARFPDVMEPFSGRPCGACPTDASQLNDCYLATQLFPLDDRYDCATMGTGDSFRHVIVNETTACRQDYRDSLVCEESSSSSQSPSIAEQCQVLDTCTERESRGTSEVWRLYPNWCTDTPPASSQGAATINDYNTALVQVRWYLDETCSADYGSYFVPIVYDNSNLCREISTISPALQRVRASSRSSCNNGTLVEQLYASPDCTAPNLVPNRTNGVKFNDADCTAYPEDLTFRYQTDCVAPRVYCRPLLSFLGFTQEATTSSPTTTTQSPSSTLVTTSATGTANAVTGIMLWICLLFVSAYCLD